MLQKIIRAGKHSLAVIIPAKFIHSLGITHKDFVQVKTNFTKGTINLKFSGTVQLHLPDSKKDEQV